MAAQITEKALIYATWKSRLLVFDEPDFPDLLPQVPGGTIEPGEVPIDAAKREFYEETGLEFGATPVFLTTTRCATGTPFTIGVISFTFHFRSHRQTIGTTVSFTQPEVVLPCYCTFSGLILRAPQSCLAMKWREP